jgi:hypothetical protein
MDGKRLTEVMVCRRIMGLVVLAWLIASVQAEQFDQDSFAPRIDLFTTQFAHSAIKLLPNFQISASVVFVRPQAVMFNSSGIDSVAQSLSTHRSRQDWVQETNSIWNQSNYQGDRGSLSNVFRVTFNEEQLNIAFRARAVLIEGAHFKVTFVPHAALIESAQFKIKFQPHSAFILWNKGF